MSQPPHTDPPRPCRRPGVAHGEPDATRPTMPDAPSPASADERLVEQRLVEDRLVALVGHHSAATLDPAQPGFVALCEWLAAEAVRAQRAGQRRRTARAAARFADAVLARRGAARVAERGALLVAAGAPPERAAPVAVPLVDAVVLARTRGCAPLLDLRVAAGAGRALWEQACDRWVELPPDTPGGRYVALGVAGDSMLPLLAPGDTLLVRLDELPAPDTLVVARTPDDGYVVKRVGRVTTRHVELRSLNPAYAPFRVRRTAGAVLGTVVLRWRGGA
ncbi:MAG TPA: S24 family peptidase [Gemmatimonadaceae bacterium]|nr:S24 family peptidase [Gemmatimonadaceae bacterium]